MDGRTVARPGVNTTTGIEVVLEPGEHVLTLIRPATSTLRRTAAEGMFLRCTFPDGCAAGDWVQL